MSQLDWENTRQLGQAWDDVCPHWMTQPLSPGVGLLFKGICLSQGHPKASAGAP